MRALSLLGSGLVCVACAEGAPAPSAPTAESPRREASTDAGSSAAGAPRAITFGSGGAALVRLSLEERYGVDVVVRAQRADGVSRTDDMVIESRDEMKLEALSPESSAEPTYRLTFGPVYEVRIHRGEQTRKDLPMTGKTYRVALRGHTAFITDDHGGHIPKDEGKSIAQRFAGYDADRSMLDRFANRPIPIGARSEEIESVLRRGFAKGIDDVEVGDVTATLMEERDIDGAPCGGFDVTAHVVFRNGEGWSFVNDLHGKLYVRTADSVFARSDLSGPVQITGAIHGVQLVADGHATFHTAHKPW